MRSGSHVFHIYIGTLVEVNQAIISLIIQFTTKIVNLKHLCWYKKTNLVGEQKFPIGAKGKSSLCKSCLSLIRFPRDTEHASFVVLAPMKY